jgi:hypothetical protein
MINATLSQVSDLTYKCSYSIEMWGEKLTTATTTGIVPQVREVMRREYRAHLFAYLDHILSLKLRDTPEAQKVTDRLREVAHYARNMHHVHVARELLTVNPFWLINFNDENTYQAIDHFHQTLKATANGQFSLWSLGPQEMLDGSIVRPWLKAQPQQKAA